jgi:hypothetical protein
MQQLTSSSGLLLALLLLAGCGAPNGAQSGNGFATEDDAVAAAERLLPRYIDALSEAASLQDDRLAPYEGLISADLMDAEVKSLRNGDERTSFLVGKFEFFAVDVTQVEVSDDYPTAFVRLRLCLDYRPTNWLNAAGVDITSADRAPWRAMEIAFIDDPDAAGKLLIDDINWWVGYDFCPTPRERADAGVP